MGSQFSSWSLAQNSFIICVFQKSKVEEMVEKFQLEIERSLQQEEEERLAIESRGRLSRSVSRSSLFLATTGGGCSSSGIATDSPAPSSCLEDNYAGPLVESLGKFFK